MTQTINPPDLDDLLAESRDMLLSNFNAVQIGKIETVNDDQTLSTKIQFLRRLPDGKTGKYPLLVDVPYFVLNGGGSYLDFPIAAGDYCLILFCDRNIDNWWNTANVAKPADTRKHNIADGIALVGINPRTKAFERNGAALRIIGPTGSNSFLSFKPDGSIDIEAPGNVEITAPLSTINGNVQVNGTIDATGNISSEADMISDSAVTAISALQHPHIGDLNYNTGPPVTVGGGIAPPATPPQFDQSDSTIDMGGQDIKNVNGISTTVGTHTHPVTTAPGTTGQPN